MGRAVISGGGGKGNRKRYRIHLMCEERVVTSNSFLALEEVKEQIGSWLRDQDECVDGKLHIAIVEYDREE